MRGIVTGRLIPDEDLLLPPVMSTSNRRRRAMPDRCSIASCGCRAQSEADRSAKPTVPGIGRLVKVRARPRRCSAAKMGTDRPHHQRDTGGMFTVAQGLRLHPATMCSPPTMSIPAGSGGNGWCGAWRRNRRNADCARRAGPSGDTIVDQFEYICAAATRVLSILVHRSRRASPSRGHCSALGGGALVLMPRRSSTRRQGAGGRHAGRSCGRSAVTPIRRAGTNG